jgi:hypothetical protein
MTEIFGWDITIIKGLIQENIVMVKYLCKHFKILKIWKNRNYWKLLLRNKKSLLLEVRIILDN